MKQKNKIAIAISIGFLALGMALSLTTTVSQPLLSGIFAVGMSLLFTSLYRHLKYGEGIEQDERTDKLTRSALSGSWFATLVLLTIIMLINELGIAKFNIKGTLSAIFFFMVLTFSGLRWYLEQKGDAK